MKYIQQVSEYFSFQSVVIQSHAICKGKLHTSWRIEVSRKAQQTSGVSGESCVYEFR